ncbi:hypothetical protein MY3296_003585 [Beauveria thailandica]
MEKRQESEIADKGASKLSFGEASEDKRVKGDEVNKVVRHCVARGRGLAGKRWRLEGGQDEVDRPIIYGIFANLVRQELIPAATHIPGRGEAVRCKRKVAFLPAVGQ